MHLFSAKSDKMQHLYEHTASLGDGSPRSVKHTTASTPTLEAFVAAPSQLLADDSAFLGPQILWARAAMSI